MERSKTAIIFMKGGGALQDKFCFVDAKKVRTHKRSIKK